MNIGNIFSSRTPDGEIKMTGRWTGSDLMEYRIEITDRDKKHVRGTIGASGELVLGPDLKGTRIGEVRLNGEIIPVRSIIRTAASGLVHVFLHEILNDGTIINVEQF
jgi:hypothetical protein